VNERAGSDLYELVPVLLRDAPNCTLHYWIVIREENSAARLRHLQGYAIPDGVQAVPSVHSATIASATTKQ
jgi:hypothetical protein